jgi:simple sugar transport system permease protein
MTMPSRWNTLWKKNEFLVGLTILGLCLFVGSVNSAFWSLPNLFDLLRSSIVLGIFALGALVVIVSGGIDVSFTAVAVLSMYITTKLLLAWEYSGPFLWICLLSCGIGLCLGLVNALFISAFRLPTLIVTLGTMSAFRGFLLAFIGSNHISVLPQAMVAFSQWDLLRGRTPDGVLYSLPGAVLFLFGAALFTWALLRYSMLGRGIYALGGDAVAAERVGFSLSRIQFFIYGYVGVLAGLGGIIHTSLSRMANPFDLVGTEMNVLAAVVLGGARITGGHGSVPGTLLGVGLVVIMNNSLILLGVPSYWQRVAVGLLLLVGTAAPILLARTRKRPHAGEEEQS